MTGIRARYFRCVGPFVAKYRGAAEFLVRVEVDDDRQEVFGGYVVLNGQGNVIEKSDWYGILEGKVGDLIKDADFACAPTGRQDFRTAWRQPYAQRSLWDRFRWWLAGMSDSSDPTDRDELIGTSAPDRAPEDQGDDHPANDGGYRHGPVEADVCARLGVTPDRPLPGSKLGVSRAALAGEWPLHGLRHRPERDTSGWYLWAGEYSDAPDFFVPLHIEHVAEQLPAASAYLALPPGFRFLIAPGHEDVWEDASLLES